MLDFEALYEKHHPIIEEIFGDVSEEMANPEYAKIHQQIIGIHEEIESELKKAEVSRFIELLTEQGKPIPDYLNQLLRDEFEVSIEEYNTETGLYENEFSLITKSEVENG